MAQLLLGKYRGGEIPTAQTGFLTSQNVDVYVGKEGNRKVFICDRQLLIENCQAIQNKLSEIENRWGSCLLADGNALGIKNVSPSVFQDILNFMKFEETPLLVVKQKRDVLPTTKQPLEVLEAAKQYGMPKVLRFCINIILNDRLNFINQGVILYETIKDITDEDVVLKRKYTEDWLIRCFNDLHKSVYFYYFSRQSLIFFLGHEHLFLSDEYEIFRSCVRWATVNCTDQGLEPTEENLRAMLGDIIKLIRFPLIPRSEFLDKVQHLGILDSHDCRQMRHFYNLLRTDRLAASRMELPYKKYRRVGQLFVTEIFPRSAFKREWHSRPGVWETIRFTSSRPMEIDTIVLSGHIDNPVAGLDGLLMTLNWRKAPRNPFKSALVQDVKANVGEGGLIFVRPKTPLRMKEGKEYFLKFKFVQTGIWCHGSIAQHLFRVTKTVSVSCEQRGQVGIDVVKDPHTCCFRGIYFRLLSS